MVCRRRVDLPVPHTLLDRRHVRSPSLLVILCTAAASRWPTAPRRGLRSRALHLQSLDEVKVAVPSVLEKTLHCFTIKYQAWSRWRTPPSPQKRLSVLCPMATKSKHALCLLRLKAHSQASFSHTARNYWSWPDSFTKAKKFNTNKAVSINPLLAIGREPSQSGIEFI